MAVEVRKAERRDLDTLGRLGAMLIRTHYAFDRQRFLPPFEGVEKGYASFLGRALDSPDDCVFVAERDGLIVGYIFAALEPLSWKELRGPAGFIHDVAVAVEARRAGIGSALLGAAEDQLLRAGVVAVALETPVNNAAAIRFYKQKGYFVEKTVAGYYSGQMDALVMTKELARSPVG